MQESPIVRRLTDDRIQPEKNEPNRKNSPVKLSIAAEALALAVWA